MFVNVTGFAVLAGTLSAMETLCSQAFGAGNYERVGVILQRAVMIVIFVLTPVVSVFWINCERILLALGQDAHIAKLASTYVMCVALYGIIFSNFR